MHVTLDVVGCGRVGSSLARCWHRDGIVRLGCIMNRSLESARAAADFVGAGRAVASADELDPADWLLLATPDSQIGGTCERLVEAGAIRPGQIVFHASGALSSAVLDAARRAGAHCASAHPIKSFAERTESSDELRGVFCGVEGDASALLALRPALEATGMHVLAIDPDRKPLYHLAAILASNHLVTLIEASLRCYESAGVPREAGVKILAPLVQGTAANVLRLGPVAALTGPVARGEVEVVRAHVAALGTFDPELARLYRALVAATLEIARAQATASDRDLTALAGLADGGL